MFPALLIQILLTLIVVGVVLWGLGQFPIDPCLSRMIRALTIVIVAIWLVYLLSGLLFGPAIHPLFVRPR